MNYSFIINPNSGSNRKKNIINKILQKYPSKEISVKITEYPGHASEIAKQELHKNTQNIIAVGGDGTVNEIASQLVGSKVNFGIVPMGSGNGFARSMLIPLKPHHALETIFKNNTKQIDVGKVNDKFFCAVAGVGIDANIAYRFQQSKKRGPVPYFIAGFKEFFKYPYSEFYIKDGDKELQYRPLTITIANANQFGNGAKIAPLADLQDGLLDICIVQKMSLLKSINAASKMFKGNISQIASYSTFTSDRIEISSKNTEINYHVDGEPFKTNDKLIFEIVPKSLNVITT